jgi:GNAT superfamily N-acetyltransferase
MATLDLPPTKIANALWLAPTNPAHEVFLQRVFIQSRKALWHSAGLSAPWVDKLLEDQFALHQRTHEEEGKKRYSYVIAAQGQWVGRLLMRSDPTALHLLDIALLPEQQKQGIGQKVMNYVQQQARARHQQLTLNADETNRAFQWYLRCGFTITQKVGTLCSMVWSAASSNNTNACQLSKL